jgi:hypothetical protein
LGAIFFGRIARRDGNGLAPDRRLFRWPILGSVLTGCLPEDYDQQKSAIVSL